jgi:hypothetical protein
MPSFSLPSITKEELQRLIEDGDITPIVENEVKNTLHSIPALNFSGSTYKIGPEINKIIEVHFFYFLEEFLNYKMVEFRAFVDDKIKFSYESEKIELQNLLYRLARTKESTVVNPLGIRHYHKQYYDDSFSITEKLFIEDARSEWMKFIWENMAYILVI